MIEDTLILEDAFNPATPDEDTELGGLTASLRLAQGFALLFARCNQPDQRRRLVAVIRERLPHLNIQEIELREPIPHLLDELRYQIAEPVPDVIFVSGLEYSLPIAAQAANTPFVLNLNASRNSFSRYIPCPLVLWTPEYVLTAIMNGAPDFFSVRSGVYFFASSLADTFAVRRDVLSGEEWTISNLSSEEKHERLATISNLLADYRNLPPDRRDLTTEATLFNRQANLLMNLGRWSEAEEALLQCIQSTEQAGDPANQAIALNNIGTIYQRQGRLQQAYEVYANSMAIAQASDFLLDKGQALLNMGTALAGLNRLADAEQAYKKSIELFETAHNQYGASAAASNLADIYLRQGNQDLALKQAERNLAAARANKYKTGVSRALYDIGKLNAQIEDYQVAEDAFKQSLQMRQQTGDHYGEQEACYALGLIFAAQGRWSEAEKYFNQALKVQRYIGDQFGQGKSLEALAVMRLTQQDAATAMQLAQEAMRVLESFSNTDEYKRTCDMIENIEHHLNAENEGVS